MPLPFIVGLATTGFMNLKKAKDTNESAKEIVEKAQKKVKKHSSKANSILEEIGKEKTLTLKSFEEFASLVQKIQNRPEFSEVSDDGLQLGEFSLEHIKNASVGYVDIGMTLLNIAAGGIFGILYLCFGDESIKKAEKNYDKALEIKEKAKNICQYLKQITELGEAFFRSFSEVQTHYYKHLDALSYIIALHSKGQSFCDYTSFNQHERKVFKNLVLLVRVLFEMCKVKLVLKKEEQEEVNVVNTQEVMDLVHKADETVRAIA